MPPGRAATSVVISTYDDKRWEDLVACVESLAGQTHPPAEVIVVVDHNPDLLTRSESEFPGVRVIPNERARGLAGARNSGSAVAGGEVIAFIDDDATAEAGWLEHLEGCFSAPQVVGAGGALLPNWRGPMAAWMPTEFYWVIGCSYTGLPKERGPVRNPIGANMAVRKSVLDLVGGFREGVSDDAPRELRARGVVRGGGNVPDDTDFAIRVKQERADAVWLYEPAARIHHSVTAERTTVGYFLRRCFEEGVGKASLARLVGSDAGLASERRQLISVLPRGLARELRQALHRPAAILRVGATLLGLAATAAGFAVETARLFVARGESSGRDAP